MDDFWKIHSQVLALKVAYIFMVFGAERCLMVA